MKAATAKSAGIDAGAANADRSNLSVRTSSVRGGRSSAALAARPSWMICP